MRSLNSKNAIRALLVTAAENKIDRFRWRPGELERGIRRDSLDATDFTLELAGMSSMDVGGEDIWFDAEENVAEDDSNESQNESTSNHLISSLLLRLRNIGALLESIEGRVNQSTSVAASVLRHSAQSIIHHPSALKSTSSGYSFEASNANALRQLQLDTLPRINRSAGELNAIFDAQTLRSKRVEQRLTMLIASAQERHQSLLSIKSAQAKVPPRIKWIVIFLFFIWPTCVAVLVPWSRALCFAVIRRVSRFRFTLLKTS
jgi:hypothetical protein